METIKKEVEIPKEMAELADALVDIVKAVKVAVADGWQTGTDLPVILAAAVTKLPAALEGIDKLPAEIKADKGKVAIALSLAVDAFL